MVRENVEFTELIGKEKSGQLWDEVFCLWSLWQCPTCCPTLVRWTAGWAGANVCSDWSASLSLLVERSEHPEETGMDLLSFLGSEGEGVTGCLLAAGFVPCLMKRGRGILWRYLWKRWWWMKVQLQAFFFSWNTSFLTSSVIGWTVMGWVHGVDGSSVPQNAEI